MFTNNCYQLQQYISWTVLPTWIYIMSKCDGTGKAEVWNCKWRRNHRTTVPGTDCQCTAAPPLGHPASAYITSTLHCTINSPYVFSFFICYVSLPQTCFGNLTWCTPGHFYKKLGKGWKCHHSQNSHRRNHQSQRLAYLACYGSYTPEYCCLPPVRDLPMSSSSMWML